MVKEPFADFLDYLINKFINKTTIVSDPANIIIGESKDLIMKADPFFPRLEILISKLKDDGYIGQGQVDQSFRFTVAGYIRREADTTTSEDMFNIIGFGRECKSHVYEANTDRRQGIEPCEGFIQIDGFTEVFFEYEMFPKISSFIIEGEAEVQLQDTHTNN